MVCSWRRHTSGTHEGAPTRVPQSPITTGAGQIVEALSRPGFERHAIFVVEDDPQDGVDHVDARTVGFVVSATLGAAITTKPSTTRTAFCEPSSLSGDRSADAIHLAANPMLAFFQANQI